MKTPLLAMEMQFYSTPMFTSLPLSHIRLHTLHNVPWLLDPGVPQILVEDIRMLRLFSDVRVFAFCILPDHVHLLVEATGEALHQCMQTFKAHSLHDIQRVQRLAAHQVSSTNTDSHIHPSPRWQQGFHVQPILTSADRRDIYLYVQHNAKYHGLVDNGPEWPWSSVHFPHVVDAMAYSDEIAITQ